MKFSVILVVMAYLAVTHHSLSQTPAKTDSLHKVLPLSKDSAKVDILNLLTDEYLFSNDDSAFHFGQAAIRLATAVHYKAGQKKAYNNLGIIYGMRGDYAHSMELFTKLLRLQEQMHDKKGQASSLSNIAKLYKEQQNYQEALKYLEQAKKIDVELNNHRNLADDFSNIGIIKKALNNLQDALQNQQQALRINYILQDTFSIANGLVNISEINFLRKQYPSARDSAQKALTLFSKLNNTYGNMYALHVMATAFLGLREYDKATDYSLQALAIAQRQQWREKELKIYSTLIQVSATSGKYKYAFEYQQKYQAVKDTLFNKEKAKMINEIKEKYDAEKREQRIQFLEDEATYEARLKTAYIVASLLVLCLLILFIRNIRHRNKILRREKHIAEQNLLLEQEKAHVVQVRIEQERVREQLDKERLLQEQERILLENERIALQLDENQRQLLTNALQIQQNREMLTDFEKTISALKKSKDPEELKKGIDQLVKNLRQQIDLSDDWEHIKLQFEKVHPSFFNNLKERFPNLTLTELKLCAYTKMNFNGKEISRLLNINPASIQVARYRLKKKMNLPEEMNFPQYITENL